MKAIILYSSYMGNTKQLAEMIADLTNIEIQGVVFGRWRIFPHFIGFHGGKYPILDLSDYDLIYAGGPVWRGQPAPGYIKLLKNLELSGKKIKCFSRAGSGNAEKVTEKLETLATEKEFELIKSIIISGKESEEEVSEKLKELIT
ncbi:MAG: flavodoxin family protein [Promethearchaeota archaeon]